MNEIDKPLIGFRLRHRIAHISVSLTVILISSLALLGHITGIQWSIITSMAPNTAICLILLAMLELFEAFNLKM